MNVKSVAISLLTGLILLGLNGCSMAQTAPTNNSESVHVESYLPVRNLTSNAKVYPLSSLVPHSQIHSISDFPNGVVEYGDNAGFYVPVWNQGPASHTNIGRVGLYFVNKSTGSSNEIVKESRDQWQVEQAVADDDWLVWQDSPNDDSTYELWCENLKTHQTERIYAVPQQSQRGNQPSLVLDGDILYWSNFITTNNGILSQICSVNLRTGNKNVLLELLARRTETASPGIIVSSVLMKDKIYYSVFNTNNLADVNASGTIYSISVNGGTPSKVLSLYHVADQLATDGISLAFTTNYKQEPNGPNNPAPFPVYVYTPGEKTIQQVTPTGPDAGEFPSISSRYVAWFGRRGGPQLYDRKTNTYYLVPGLNVRVFEDTLFWSDGNSIFWSKLPS
ncbi:MAG: hypothetical protein K6T81_09240 [Alicyclobacillus macrosporangiidus]|uniref:hypothetical protein n=1 Tax=Alicyclobacillus macrosporangiidus TaxID=392015 RepID=UPI0026E961B9|nr:hypothetical protein [Alicyclobacillus macrosporangiidus]MCL6598914.1 hypothetical protein [Alicyclobacillus macrosporangiidus]